MRKAGYGAFISYAHTDERWARKLQRSLEAYRTPRRLAGLPGRHGAVPARLGPVFRDREDLSTAASLSTEVTDALAASDALVVVCSPAAARSRWVNEEIRCFRALRGAGRIHPFVVAGRPEQLSGAEASFPPALLEACGGEPLAADARPRSDGPRLAQQKLLAGLLGVSLDDLRQREQQRRYRRTTIALGGALVVSVTVTILAVTALFERDRARRATEDALARSDYMLGDLRRMLEEEGQFEILQEVSSFIARQGEKARIEGLSEAELRQTALAWQQLSDYHRSRGELDEAMDRARRSLAVFKDRWQRTAGDAEAAFDLSQAMFYVASTHNARGEYEAADRYFREYLRIAEQLYAEAPDNATFALELAYAYDNLAYNSLVRASVPPATVREHAAAAVRHYLIARELAPDDDALLADLANGYANLADAELALCRLGEAYKARFDNVQALEALQRSDGRNVNWLIELANAQSGLGNVQRRVGDLVSARESLSRSVDLMARVVSRAPSIERYQWNHGWKRWHLAELDALTEDPASMGSTYEELAADLERLAARTEELALKDRVMHARFLHGYGKIARRAGNEALAAGLLAEGAQRLDHLHRAFPDRRDVQIAWLDFQAHRWQSGEALEASVRASMLRFLDEGHKQPHCDAVALRVRLAVVTGRHEDGAREAAYLDERGYFEPEYRAFCARHGLCDT